MVALTVFERFRQDVIKAGPYSKIAQEMRNYIKVKINNKHITADEGNIILKDMGLGDLNSLEIEVKDNINLEDISDIENISIKVNAANPITVNLSNSNSITQLNNIESNHDLIINGLLTKLDKVVWKNGNDINSDFTINIATSVLGNSDDIVTVDVSNITAGAAADFKIGPFTALPGQSYNTIILNSIGDIPNSFQLSAGNNDSLTKLNVTGTQKITFNAVPASITIIDASAMAAGAIVTPNMGVTNLGTTARVIGGVGDDIIIFGTASDGNDIDVDGRGGNDTLIISSDRASAVTSTLTTVKNIEIIKIGNRLEGNVDLTYFNGANILHLTRGSNTAEVTINSGNIIKIEDRPLLGPLTITAKTNGSHNVVNLEFIDDIANGQNIDVNNIYTLNINCVSPTVIGKVTMPINNDGTQILNFVGRALIVNTVTADKVDASNIIGDEGMFMKEENINPNGMIIIGSKNKDDIYTSNGSDFLTGGKGDDGFFISHGSLGAKATITDIDLGTNNTAVDKIHIILVNKLNGENLVVPNTTVIMSDTSNNIAESDDVTVVDRTSGTIANADLVKLSGTYANTAAAILGLDLIDHFTLGANLEENSAILIAYKTADSDNSDINIDVVAMDNNADNDSAHLNQGTTIITLSGAASQFAGFDSSDIQYI